MEKTCHYSHSVTTDCNYIKYLSVLSVGLKLGRTLLGEIVEERLNFNKKFTRVPKNVRSDLEMAQTSEHSYRTSQD